MEFNSLLNCFKKSHYLLFDVLCVGSQVSPLTFPCHGSGVESDGDLYEEQDFRGEEMADMKEDNSHYSLSQERHRYVLYIQDMTQTANSVCRVQVEYKLVVEYKFKSIKNSKK